MVENVVNVLENEIKTKKKAGGYTGFLKLTNSKKC